MESIEEKGKNNSELINCLDANEWVKLLKEIAVSYLFLPKEEEIEAIYKATNITIKYCESGIETIVIYTSKFPYEDYEIKLDILSITISKQKGHSAFERLFTLPISVIRTLFKSDLCN